MVLVFAAPALSVLPKAGLAALVIYAALKLIEVREFRSLWSFNRIEFALALITTIAVLGVGILYGVLVAVGLSVLAMLACVARPHAAALGFVRGLAGMHDIQDFDDAAEVPGLLVFRYDSPLFFANAEDFRRRRCTWWPSGEPELRWFALNCEAITKRRLHCRRRADQPHRRSEGGRHHGVSGAGQARTDRGAGARRGPGAHRGRSCHPRCPPSCRPSGTPTPTRNHNDLCVIPHSA